LVGSDEELEGWGGELGMVYTTNGDEGGNILMEAGGKVGLEFLRI